MIALTSWIHVGVSLVSVVCVRVKGSASAMDLAVSGRMVDT